MLDCCVAIGDLQGAFAEAHLEAIPRENAEAMQRLLYRACTRVKLCVSAAPEGMEARARMAEDISREG